VLTNQHSCIQECAS